MEDAAVEQAILAAVGKGDIERAAALINRHYGPALLGHARRLVGREHEDDVFQNGFIAVVEALRKGLFKGESSLKSYAVVAVRHAAFRWKSSWLSRLFRGAEPVDGENDVAAPSSRKPSPWDHADEQEMVRIVLGLLDNRQRAVVSMRLFDQATFAAIGSALEISEENARKIYTRALRDVRAHFDVDERGVPVLRKKPRAPGGRRR